MPFAFTLATTSSLSYPAFVGSESHPSLPFSATTYREVLKNVLKRHKRLAPTGRASNLSTVLSALNDYVPYLLALDAALGGKTICAEEVDLILEKEVEVEWRSTLTATLPGREAARVKGKGLDYEYTFVLHTLACTYTLQARAQLLALYAAITPTSEQRTTIIATATKLLLQSNAIHNHLASRSAETDAPSVIVETLSQTQSALAALALAEATLLAVLKDDPYPAIVAQDRNPNDKSWMVKPPDIPKVRAHLFARLCLAAAEHAGRVEAMLSASARIDETLIKYVVNLKKSSRAKACRFFGIDAELGGETGQAIAWLIGGKEQLGFADANTDGSKIKGIAKIKKDWTERREDKKIEKGSEWGSDAGRLEELRVNEMLEHKWTKMNDTINTQSIPPSGPLLSSMPSGRDIHSTKPYIPSYLDENTLAQMRAPADYGRMERLVGGNSSDSSDEGDQAKSGLPGAFPGSGASLSNNSYY